MGLNRAIRRQAYIARAVLGTALFLRVMGVGGTPQAEGLAGKTPEEMRRERGKAMEAQILVEENKWVEENKIPAAEKKKPVGVKKTPPQKVLPPEEKAVREELKGVEKELLRFPKKDRFRFGGDFDTTHDTNPTRLAPHHEEGDTTFNLNPFAEVDLSGRRTDLRIEYRESNKYNAKRSVDPGNDKLGQEMRLRFGRKLLKKTTLSLNDRLSRDSARTAGIDDGKKIQWGNSHRAGLSYELSKKFTVSFETLYTRTDFSHKNFGKDTNYQFELSPSFAFQVTPKTQVSASYRWNFNRVRTHATDAATNEVRLRYSGKLTPKSTASADIAYTKKNPEKSEAARSNQIVVSVGYIWQVTPKTSLRTQYAHSWERSITDKVGTTDALPFIETDTLSVSDTASVSTRFRLHRKLNLEFSFNGSHSPSKTNKTGEFKIRNRLFNFPFQVAIDYDLARWIRLRFTYTYRYQIGNEPKADEFRAHTWFFGTNLSF